MAKSKLEKLYKFKLCDKYETFAEAMPGIQQEGKDQQEIIEHLLNTCCKELLALLEQKKPPAQRLLKECISRCMDGIEQSAATTFNKDFGYELCWYLNDTVGCGLKFSSERKSWGFWKAGPKEVVVFNKKKAARPKKKVKPVDVTFTINQVK